MCGVKLSRVVWAVSHVFLVGTDLFTQRGNRKGRPALHTRRKRLETFKLLRTYRVYVFLRSFREAHRGCTSVWAHVCHARVEERVPLEGFPPIVARHPTLSSRTIVKPPLSGHINTSTSVLSSTREVDMSPNPPSPRRTLVILNNVEPWLILHCCLQIRFVDPNYFAISLSSSLTFE